MKITVVIAAYNESENIGPLTTRLISVLDSLESARWELVYVIEGTDETRLIAESFARDRPEIRVLYSAEPSGLGVAFRNGFDAVSPDTDVVVTMDADLNHQPEEMPRLVKALFERSADIVVGSRKVAGSVVEGIPLWKRTVSYVVNRSMRRVAGILVADMSSGYRAYRFDALRKISFDNTGYAFLPEILARAHVLELHIIEEPIKFIYRVAGESKMELMPTIRSYIALFAGKLRPVRPVQPGRRSRAAAGGRT
jgi:dolichol-phosphate mannosyltransferase